MNFRKIITKLLFWNCLMALLFLLPQDIFAQKQCSSLLTAKSGEKWGFVNKTGKFVIPAKFDFVYDFSDNRAFVEQDKLLGIINEKGDWVMFPRIKGYVLPMTEGTFLAVENGKRTFLNKDGNPLTKGFDDASQLWEGLAAVRDDDKWGYIDSTGNIAIPFRYDHASGFDEGLAEVIKDGNDFFIDQTGQKVFDISSEMLVAEFSEGLAKFKLNDLYGFINKKGKIVIEPKFYDAENFSEGLAIVSTKSSTYYGFINKSGKILIEPKYKDAKPFSEGLASVKINEKWGFIDKHGKVIVPIKFESADNFECGVARVKVIDKIRYINTQGDFIF